MNIFIFVIIGNGVRIILDIIICMARIRQVTSEEIADAAVF
jgi:hypothetical protein